MWCPRVCFASNLFDSVQTELTHQNYDRAIKLLTEELEHPSQNDPTYRYKILLWLGDIAHAARLFFNSSEMYRLAFECARSAFGKASQKSQTAALLAAQEYFLIGECRESRALLTEMDISGAPEKLRSQLSTALARVCCETPDIETFSFHRERMLSLLKSGDHSIVAQASVVLARMYQIKSEPQQGLDILSQVKPIVDTTDDQQLFTDYADIICSLHIQLGHLNEAEKVANDAIAKLREQLDSNSTSLFLLGKLQCRRAEILGLKGDTESALEEAHVAISSLGGLNVSTALNDSHYRIRAALQIVNCLIKTGRLFEAEHSMNLTRRIDESPEQVHDRLEKSDLFSLSIFEPELAQIKLYTLRRSAPLTQVPKDIFEEADRRSAEALWLAKRHQFADADSVYTSLLNDISNSCGKDSTLFADVSISRCVNSVGLVPQSFLNRTLQNLSHASKLSQAKLLILVARQKKLSENRNPQIVGQLEHALHYYEVAGAKPDVDDLRFMLETYIEIWNLAACNRLIQQFGPPIDEVDITATDNWERFKFVSSLCAAAQSSGVRFLDAVEPLFAFNSSGNLVLKEVTHLPRSVHRFFHSAQKFKQTEQERIYDRDKNDVVGEFGEKYFEPSVSSKEMSNTRALQFAERCTRAHLHSALALSTLKEATSSEESSVTGDFGALKDVCFFIMKAQALQSIGDTKDATIVLNNIEERLQILDHAGKYSSKLVQLIRLDYCESLLTCGQIKRAKHECDVLLNQADPNLRLRTETILLEALLDQEDADRASKLAARIANAVIDDHHYVSVQGLGSVASTLYKYGNFDLAEKTAAYAIDNIGIFEHVANDAIGEFWLIRARCAISRNDIKLANFLVAKAKDCAVTKETLADLRVTQAELFKASIGEKDFDLLLQALDFYNGQPNRKATVNAVEVMRHLTDWSTEPTARQNWVLRIAEKLNLSCKELLPQLGFDEQCVLVNFAEKQISTFPNYTLGDGASTGYSMLMNWKGLLLDCLQKQKVRLNGKPSLNEPDKSVLDLNQLQRALFEGEVFFDFYKFHNEDSNSDYYVCYAIDHDSVEAFLLGSAGAVNKSIQAKLNSLREKNSTSKNRDFRMHPSSGTKNAATDSFENFIDPLLTKAESYKGVCICADSELCLVPWRAIMQKKLHDVSVSQVDSARQLFQLRSTSGSVPLQSSLICGGSNFGHRLPNLSGAANECSALFDMHSKKLQHSKVCTIGTRKEQILQSLEQNSILHFATHGFVVNSEDEARASGINLSFDNRNPLFDCGLVLPCNNESSSIPELIRASDIALLDLKNCRLASLSACETGLGIENTGQGLLGLRSAFISAGARCILASMWPVDDSATEQFMQNFYSGLLRDGATPQSALAEAQQSMQKNEKWSSPCYWACWTVVGDSWTPVNLSR